MHCRGCVTTPNPLAAQLQALRFPEATRQDREADSTSCQENEPPTIAASVDRPAYVQSALQAFLETVLAKVLHDGHTSSLAMDASSCRP